MNYFLRDPHQVTFLDIFSDILAFYLFYLVYLRRFFVRSGGERPDPQQGACKHSQVVPTIASETVHGLPKIGQRSSSLRGAVSMGNPQ